MINNRDRSNTNQLEYRLHYLHDGDDMDPRYYYSDNPVKEGDVIHNGNFYHFVAKVTQQKTGVRLSLCKSAQSVEEAELLAKQLL